MTCSAGYFLEFGVCDLPILCAPESAGEVSVSAALELCVLNALAKVFNFS